MKVGTARVRVQAPPVESSSTLPEADFVVSAIVGVAGLEATHAAIVAGKPVGLANKECMVAAGEILTCAAREHNVPILPIDSEHNAIFQCLAARNGSPRSRQYKPSR